ncbi:anks1b, partial [Symbiodinium sp. CCMP2592]
MKGDGNCLFHALADKSHEEGEQVRTQIIQYLQENAASQEDEEQVGAWTEEAEYLESDPGHWGGDTAIVAFSLMRQQRVILHWREDDGHIQTYERTHMKVRAAARRVQLAEQDDAEAIHLWYNGRNHYDRLVLKQDQPPDPGPSTSDHPGGPQDAEEAPPLPPPPAPHPKPRPPKRQKTTTDQANCTRPTHSKELAEPAEAGTPDEAQGGEPSLLEELTRIPVAAKPTQRHPRRNLEDALKRFAKTRLRAQPLIPPDAKAENVDKGEAWPRVFCAFQECTWSSFSGTEQELHQHVRDAHAEELKLVAQHLPRPLPSDAITSIYNEAIALQCREAAPVAGSSRDRSALRSFAEATSKDNVESLICFSCACIHPRTADTTANSRIGWRKLIQSPASNDESHAESTAELHELLNIDKYLSYYDDLAGDAKLTDVANFDDWTVTIPGFGNILCCPE